MASKDFVKIGNTRIRISTIKRFEPFSSTKIAIRFSSSTSSPMSETFDLKNEKARDEMIELLDIMVVG